MRGRENSSSPSLACLSKLCPLPPPLLLRFLPPPSQIFYRTFPFFDILQKARAQAAALVGLTVSP